MAFAVAGGGSQVPKGTHKSTRLETKSWMLARLAVLIRRTDSFRFARHTSGMDWNTGERLRGIRFHKERWPVIAGRVMLSATKEPYVGLWLLSPCRPRDCVTPCERCAGANPSP